MQFYNRLKDRAWTRATIEPIFIAAHEKIQSKYRSKKKLKEAKLRDEGDYVATPLRLTARSDTLYNAALQLQVQEAAMADSHSGGSKLLLEETPGEPTREWSTNH